MDSIVSLLGAESKELVRSSITQQMPVEGDTSISEIVSALASHRLRLLRVNGEYIRKGGAPFHILQRRECKLIVKIKLVHIDGEASNHFVAWDGLDIYDEPFLCKITRNDRKDAKKARKRSVGSTPRRSINAGRSLGFLI